MKGVDRLNEVTDEMLVNNIMSRLDCTTKELIRTTATISKRWKNLWTQLPNLSFIDDKDNTAVQVKRIDLGYSSFIDNTLNQCSTDLNLTKFKLYICNNSYFSDQFKSRSETWIRYAISRNVEEVDLWLWDGGVGHEFTFEDELFFNNLCFTRVKLSDCRFNPPNGAISWARLEYLCLYCVSLDENMIEKILSGSPCLESLELKDCYGFTRIDVTSKSVKKLVFSEYHCYDASIGEGYKYRIKINAPYISSLIIKGELVLQELLLLNVSSLINAELDYSIGWWKTQTSDEEIFRRLLESLDHVKDITINDECWELYSRLKASGHTTIGCSLLIKS